MTNEIVSITSHSNTQYKLELLFECITTLKNQGYSIILNSHIHVPNHIVDMVDYYIYDKQNPLIYWNEYQDGGGISFWINSPKYYLNKLIDFNHGYAVLRFLKNSTQLASANGYTKIHFVDYDYIIKDEQLLQKHSNLLEEYQGVFYERDGSLVSGFFSFRVNDFLELSSVINSKKEYCLFGVPILENLLLHLIDNKGIIYYKEDIENIKDKNDIDLLNQNYIYGLYDVDNYFVRLIICFDGLKYYLLTQSSEEDNENKLHIYYRGDNYTFDILNQETFIELPEIFVQNEFECNFSKKKLNLIFNSQSNIAECNIKDESLIKKLNYYEIA